MHILSIEVSTFDYNDYCIIFDAYGNDGSNIELRKIIDRLGFNFERPNMILTKADGNLVEITPSTSQEEIYTQMKDATHRRKLGLWTVYKYSSETFNSEISKLFNHTCKIDYRVNIGTPGYDDIVTIRRIYTMSPKLNTVQMVEFILEPIENKNNENENDIENTVCKKWRMKYFDCTKTTQPYILAIKKIYDFYIEKDFEEIDDNAMWEHELFQPGLHILEH